MEEENEPVLTPSVFANEDAIDIYIGGEIYDSKHYHEMFDIIRSAAAGERINFHINSEGGSLFTTLQLINAMRDSSAELFAYVEGACMSSATLIFLSAEYLHVEPHSLFMFHNYASAVDGKGGEMKDHVNGFNEWCGAIWKEFYTSLLTADELRRLLDGKDFYFSGDEVMKRLDLPNTTPQEA